LSFNFQEHGSKFSGSRLQRCGIIDDLRRRISRSDYRSRYSEHRIAGDEMAGHLRHRHALRQAKDLEIEIKVPFRPAVAAVHLQKLAHPDRIAADLRS
jgi:hypothetical protein